MTDGACFRRRVIGILIGLGVLGAVSLLVANLLLNKPGTEVQAQLASIHDPYFSKAVPLLCGCGQGTQDDFGRFNVTRQELDRHYFKVPTLRNVAVTWPYFHNGSTSDLREAVQIMAEHQVEQKLNEQQLDQITAFLKTLTGEYPKGQPLK